MDEGQSHSVATSAQFDLATNMSLLSVVHPTEEFSSCESILSAFERLPGELFREIVQYVPESFYDLRLVSFILISFISQTIKFH